MSVFGVCPDDLFRFHVLFVELLFKKEEKKKEEKKREKKVA